MQIKAAILDRTFKTDEKLPSIRSLAKALKVGVTTVKRSYDDLIKDQYLYSVAGKGVFVSEINEHKISNIYLNAIKTKLIQIKPLYKRSDMTKDELYKLINEVILDE